MIDSVQVFEPDSNTSGNSFTSGDASVQSRLNLRAIRVGKSAIFDIISRDPGSSACWRRSDCGC